MKSVQIYDRPMCCSTGVCGPSVDPVLPRFAADLDWLQSAGVQVERFNLSQQPLAFAQNQEIRALLTAHGADCLPVVVVDGRIVGQGEYPTRTQLAAWTGATAAPSPLPLVKSSACCQSGECS